MREKNGRRVNLYNMGEIERVPKYYNLTVFI